MTNNAQCPLPIATARTQGKHVDFSHHHHLLLLLKLLLLASYNNVGMLSIIFPNYSLCLWCGRQANDDDNNLGSLSSRLKLPTHSDIILICYCPALHAH